MPMIYQNYERNHVIVPGREKALANFLDQTYKRKNAVSSNSEDALTWSCFDLIASLPNLDKAAALDEIFEDAFEGESPLSFQSREIPNSDIDVHVGKTYNGTTLDEETEVDASIEAPGILVFFEAKLYSSVHAANPLENKRHDQIARKLRVGLDSVSGDDREFYFVFLDIAPVDKMYERRGKEEAIQAGAGGSYKDKWRSAWLYQYYKKGANGSLRPLTDALEKIESGPEEEVARRMGWLTWADLFKCVLRAVLRAS